MSMTKIRTVATQATYALCALTAMELSHVRADLAASFPPAESIALNQPAPDADEASVDVDAASGSDWRFDLRTYIWLVGLQGDVGARGRTAHVDADFADILEASDSLVAISGRIEAGKGRLGAFVEGIYSRLGADDQSGPAGKASVDVSFDMAVVDFGLMYRVAEWAPHGRSAGSRQGTSIDVYGGGRYTSLDLELNPANLESQSRSKSWLDPIVGAKLVVPLSQRWYTHVYGDIGGFGVESDFTWSAAALVGYDFTLFKRNATVFAGYRGVGQDFSEGNGTNEFVWDTVLHGPLIGLNIQF